MTIRKAKPFEAKKLTELTLRSKAYWGYSQSFIESCRNELTVTVSSLNSASFHYYVAIEDSELLGYYAIENVNGQVYELEALFVEPEFIGKGIGRELIDHAKNQIKSLGGTRLIIQGDPNAEKFYKAAGGKTLGYRESESINGRILPLFVIDLTNDGG